ncbi:DUF3850 domain-containing protein [Lachnospiraceae bacterium ZAX-1]
MKAYYFKEEEIVDHELKLETEHFCYTRTETKMFEIRINDRDYKVGDTVNLNECQDGEETGRYLKVEITCITQYEQKDGYAVLGIKERW